MMVEINLSFYPGLKGRSSVVITPAIDIYNMHLTEAFRSSANSGNVAATPFDLFSPLRWS